MEDSIIINIPKYRKNVGGGGDQKNLSLAINLVRACGEQKQSANKL